MELSGGPGPGCWPLFSIMKLSGGPGPGSWPPFSIMELCGGPGPVKTLGMRCG